MKEMRTFQLIILGIFGIILVLGVMVFAGVLPAPGSGGEDDLGLVMVWGTWPRELAQNLFDQLAYENEWNFALEYVEKNPQTLTGEYVEALADRQGPDLILLPPEFLFTQESRLSPWPYEKFTERSFRDSFINGADVYLSQAGVTALPWLVDPLVLYYNRELLAAAGVARPPAIWTDVINSIPLLARKDSRNNLTQSAVALGETGNIRYFKDILSLLFIQAGSPIVARSEAGVEIALKNRADSGFDPATRALDFYTQFADPARPAAYSWNRSLPEDRAAFVAGTLAYYLGYASELATLKRQNPHLDFDVAIVPQREAGGRLILARFWALGVARGAPNPGGAYTAAAALSSRAAAEAAARAFGLPPARKDLLATRQTDPYQELFYDSAISARTWYDFAPEGTRAVFAQMVGEVNSGRFSAAEAVGAAQTSLENLLRNNGN